MSLRYYFNSMNVFLQNKQAYPLLSIIFQLRSIQLFRCCCWCYHGFFVTTTRQMVMHKNQTCTTVMRLNINVTLNICIITTIMIFLIISNVIMINGIWKTNLKLQLCHKLYIYQCILGLFDGFFMLPLYSLTQILENEVRCSIALLTLFGIIHQSLLELTTLALLSISRYYRISYHFSFSGKRVMFVYILTYAFTVGIASIMVWYRSISDIKILAYISIGLCIMNFMLQAIIVSANILLLKYVRQIGEENIMNNINIDYQKYAIKTILLLSISLIICAFPTISAVCISSYQRLKEGKTYVLPMHTCNWLIFYLRSFRELIQLFTSFAEKTLLSIIKLLF